MSKKLDGKLIHVFNSHGIGDVVMSLPMLRALLSEGARILLTVKGKTEATLVRCTIGSRFQDRVKFIYFSELRGVKGIWRYLSLLRSYDIDISISATGIHKEKYSLMAFLSGARKRIGLGGKLSLLNHKNVVNITATHKVQKNLEIIDCSLGLTVDNVDLPIYKSNKATIRDIIFANYGKLVAFAPSSGELESHKRWPASKFKELAKRLVSKGYSVILLGGPGEEELGDYIIKGLDDEKVRNYAGKLTISESLECMSYCDVIVANCNGLSHMASLLPQLQIIGVYGPTDPRVTGPYRDDLISVQLGLECSPCYRRGYTQGCGNAICMQHIDISLVENHILN
ncbi:hypothetical protein BZJ19_16940 [Salinivibrio proteolyticus]|uniref:glycosyltransferase family 9 protein n=1 Tax=Salinivibrio proteolyticus TaxID=334715 RepID=UPI000988D681|nr:glycosyltransferase family 9 protein [Salinivibrio proteolyticus]OOF20760.1 hypothetical protein BZJ19_16940 [Salinivibrio proteolyticus]